MAPGTGTIRSHRGATDVLGHPTSALCEQQAASVTGGPALASNGARPV